VRINDVTTLPGSTRRAAAARITAFIQAMPSCEPVARLAQAHQS